MPILKKGFERDFTMLNNYCFKDKSLSFKEIGLLCNMLSLPDDWKFNVRGLTTLHTDGYESVANTLNSLIKHGYVYREQQLPSKETNGKLGEIIYWIYDNPSENPYFKGFNQRTGNQITENPELLNTNKLNTNKLNTNIKYNNKIKIEKENKETNKINKYIVVEKESNLFDIDRFINSELVKTDIARYYEAYGNAEITDNAINLLTKICNSYGVRKRKIINSFTDKAYQDLLHDSIYLVDPDIDDRSIRDKSAYLNSTIQYQIDRHLESNT